MNKKKTFLVTGGNRGIGLAIVKGLAKESQNRVLLGSRDIEMGESEAEKISSNVECVGLDLSNTIQLQNQIQEIQSKYDHIDVLINNAAVLYDEKFLDMDQRKFENVIQVNVLAPCKLIQTLAPQMIENRYGRIVNISSGWGSFQDGLTGPFSYSLTKASLNAITLNLSQSLPQFVKINSMCPGWVRTRMGGMNALRSPEEGAQTALWLANLPEDGPTGGFFRDQKMIPW